jgi:hypothetical protein
MNICIVYVLFNISILLFLLQRCVFVIYTICYIHFIMNSCIVYVLFTYRCCCFLLQRCVFVIDTYCHIHFIVIYYYSLSVLSGNVHGTDLFSEICCSICIGMFCS